MDSHKSVNADLGLRFDRDSITTRSARSTRWLRSGVDRGQQNTAKGGAGLHDRVPLNIPTFVDLPSRTVAMLDPTVTCSVDTYSNVMWFAQPQRGMELEVDRQVKMTFAAS